MQKGSQPAPHSSTINLNSGKRSNTPDMINWLAEKGPPVVISTWPIIQAAASCGVLSPFIGDEMPPCKVIGMPTSSVAAQNLSSSGIGELEPLGKLPGLIERMPGRFLTRCTSAMASSMDVLGTMAAPASRSGYSLQKSDSQLL